MKKYLLSLSLVTITAASAMDDISQKDRDQMAKLLEFGGTIEIGRGHMTVQGTSEGGVLTGKKTMERNNVIVSNQERDYSQYRPKQTFPIGQTSDDLPEANLQSNEEITFRFSSNILPAEQQTIKDAYFAREQARRLNPNHPEFDVNDSLLKYNFSERAVVEPTIITKEGIVPGKKKVDITVSKNEKGSK